MLHQQPPLENSNHANNTATSSVVIRTAKTTTTAQQMRTTLIYLAPYLQSTAASSSSSSSTTVSVTANKNAEATLAAAATNHVIKKTYSNAKSFGRKENSCDEDELNNRTTTAPRTHVTQLWLSADGGGGGGGEAAAAAGAVLGSAGVCVCDSTCGSCKCSSTNNSSSSRRSVSDSASDSCSCSFCTGSIVHPHRHHHYHHHHHHHHHYPLQSYNNNNNNKTINCESNINNSQTNTGRHCTKICCTAASCSRSSCCHNKNNNHNNVRHEQQQQQQQPEAQQQLLLCHEMQTLKELCCCEKDKCYEMPALETTTTNTTSTNTNVVVATTSPIAKQTTRILKPMLFTNLIRQVEQQQQQQQHQAPGDFNVNQQARIASETTTTTQQCKQLEKYEMQEEEEEVKETTLDNLSLLTASSLPSTATTLLTTSVTVSSRHTSMSSSNTTATTITSCSSSAVLSPFASSTSRTATLNSFINYSSNRSTKYLRERAVARKINVQQQTFEAQARQQHRQPTIGETLCHSSQTYAEEFEMQQQQQRPDHRNILKQQQRRATPCGRVLEHSNDNNKHSTDSAINDNRKSRSMVNTNGKHNTLTNCHRSHRSPSASSVSQSSENFETNKYPKDVKHTTKNVQQQHTTAQASPIAYCSSSSFCSFSSCNLLSNSNKTKDYCCQNKPTFNGVPDANVNMARQHQQQQQQPSTPMASLKFRNSHKDSSRLYETCSRTESLADEEYKYEKQNSNLPKAKKDFTTLQNHLSTSSSLLLQQQSSKMYRNSFSTSCSSSAPSLNSYTTIKIENIKECRCFTTNCNNKRDIIGSELINLDTKLETKETSVVTPTPSAKSSPAIDYSVTISQLWFMMLQWCFNNILFGCCKLTKKLFAVSSVPSPSFGSLVCLSASSTVLTKWLFMWLLLFGLTSPGFCWAGRNDVPTNCTFPPRWEGSWFLSGYQQSIHIKGSEFSYRGKCAASEGNKYLIVDGKGCHRCLVIYEKHKNVLQYKESECDGDSMYTHQTNPSAMAVHSSVLNQKSVNNNNNGGEHRGGAHPNMNGHPRLSSVDQYIMRSNDDIDCNFCKGRETLQNLCDQIPGDALLYSLFRESAEPVKCPLKGPFIFTYNRGNGECKSPVSNIESCTEDSRLLLSFQACPDVVGTESTVEELTCLATWKDGNSRYLVGLVSHHHAISNEERYRCFVYEKISSLMDMGHFAGPSMSTSKDAEYKLAQSGDATCNGLDSAEVGSRIMSLRKPPVTERCDFPVWFKGPRHWHVLMGNAVYNYHTNDGSIHIIKPNGYMETRALCEQINKQTSTEMMSVVHYTTGCQSGFMCMVFYRRDTHVIEIQTGKPASRLEDACAPDHFDINKTPYITLLASNPDPQICPLEGLYNLRGAIGPPYMTTRHKRNHNNKIHNLHNHRHQYDSMEYINRAYSHKRHSSLSFRNSPQNERNAWHSNTRGLPVRSRRDTSTTENPLVIIKSDNNPNLTSSNDSIRIMDNKILVLEDGAVNSTTTNPNILANASSSITSVGFVALEESDTTKNNTRLRSRRNVPECITNYKAQRQLWVGCTEPNVIDVRPLCNDEGDEEYSCHGSWSENGTVFIIARHKGTKHGVCISYRPTEGTSAKLVIGDACYRGTQKPPEHHLVANLSVFGKCGDTSSISSTIPVWNWLNVMASAVLILCLSQFGIQR